MKRISRRAFLAGGGAATGLLLRSLATGLPPAFLLNPRLSRAQQMPPLQTLILATSSRGDPVNVNCPGSYVPRAQNNPLLEARPVVLGDTQARGAMAWRDLPGQLRNRLAFFHCQTRSAAHPEYASTMSFHGSVKNAAGNGSEMFASMLAELGGPTLGTLQNEPLPLCNEVISVGGQPLQNLKPSEVKALFAPQEDRLANLRDLRDTTLTALYAPLRENGRTAEKAFVDRYLRSRDQSRDLGDQFGVLLDSISSDPDTVDNVTDQVTAAVVMAQLGIAPVITINIPFGGDNHRDSDLSIEAAETNSGVAAILSLWNKLNAVRDINLQDSVTFAMLNVFGRGLQLNSAGGRNHNRQHATVVAFGAGIAPGVYGGVEIGAGAPDAIALDIDPQTGAGLLVRGTPGSIPASETLESAGKSIARAMGHTQRVVDERIQSGQVVEAFLAG